MGMCNGRACYDAWMLKTACTKERQRMDEIYVIRTDLEKNTTMPMTVKSA